MATLTVSVTDNVKNCALVGYYAASSGNHLPTFPDNLSGPNCKGQESLPLEYGTYKLSRNVSTELPLLAT